MITMPSFDISYVVNSTFDNKTSQVDTSTCLKQINRRKVKQPASNMDFINSIPTHMDFEGQARAERISRIIITLFGIVGLVWGYIIQQFSQTVYILGAGFLLASLLTIPPWPMFRRKPLQWQKVKPDNASQSKKKK